MAEQTLPAAGGVIEVSGLRFEATGLTGVIREASVTRGDSPLPAGLGDALARQDCRLAAPLVEVEAEIDVRRSGAAAAPRLRLHPPTARTTRGAEPTEESFAIVVDDDGLVRWAVPDEDGAITVPLDPVADGAQRGLVGGLIRKGIQWVTAPLVDKVLGTVGKAFVRRWEARHRPHRLRLVRGDIAALPDDDLTGDEARRLLAGPTLLLIHGTMSSTASGFGGLQPYLNEIRSAYGGRVIAFDHPTLGHDPDENGGWLAERLTRLLGGGGTLTVDLVGHSRGGLVSRVLAERPQAIGLPPGLLDVRTVTFAGTPNAGTPLCDVDHLTDLLDTYTNLLALLPDGGVSDVLDVIVTVVRQLATGVYAGLDGAMAMDPRGNWLAGLNRPADVTATYRAITADFEPPRGASVARRLRDVVTDRVFGRDANDLVVPTDGTIAANGSSKFPITAHLRLDPEPDDAVDHFHFFDHPDSAAQLRSWLRADREGIDVGPVHRPRRPRATATATAPRRAAAATPDDVRARPDREPTPVGAVDEALAAGDMDRLRRSIETLGNEDRAELERSVGAPLDAHLGRARGARDGTVVVLPGILGSNLDVVERGDTDRIWIQLWRLLTGQFRRLRYVEGQRTVRPAGVHRTYIPLLLALDARFTVVPFAYDWRIPLRASARVLAARVRELQADDDGPVHLVAHSMGGLVARHLLADDADTDTPAWSHPEARLVQLGTPNKGSFDITPVLTGDDRIVTWLAVGDLISSKPDILAIVRGFPAVHQLLPAPDVELGDDHAALYDVATWPAGTPRTMTGLLQAAAAAHRRLAAAEEHHPTGRMAMVLGTDHPTTFRLRIRDGAFRFGRTQRGDGRVPHELARLVGVDTYYSSANHGGLVSDERVLAALPALLRGGAVALPTTDTAGTRADLETVEPNLTAADIAVPPPTPRGDTTELSRDERLHAIAEVPRDWLGAADRSTTRPRRPLTIDVTHGRLEHEPGPWIVGHVAGTPLTGAETSLDGVVDGALRHHHLVREYPDEVGEPLVVADQTGGEHAIVVGLGPWGELTAPQLSDAVTRGVLRYLVTPRPRRADAPILRLTSVLIGSSGDAGLTIPQTVAAVTSGVLAANRQASGLGGPLTSPDTTTAPAIDHLRFVELYEERAIQAASAVRRLALDMDPQSVGDTELQPALVMRTGHGGRAGQPPADSHADAWRRLVIGSEGDRLELTLLGRRAAAPQSVHGLLPDVERMTGAPGSIPRTDPDWLVTLWHLLIPAELRHGLTGNLQLALDQRAAGLPWEMLATQDRAGAARPLGLRVGMVRQLVDLHADTRLMSASPTTGGDNALVIGDPPTGGRYPRLAGARREAAAVADMLTRRGMAVTQLIYDEHTTDDRSAEILTALYSRPWEIVHIAAHGDHDPNDPNASGVIIGPDQTLRGEHVASLSSTPAFVVLNCCHLARVDTGTVVAGTAATRTALPRFAASIARALMRHGVHAVVAAGWAVDDAPAERFATTLYQQMLGGAPYGEAVRVARRMTHAAQPSSATWGAYQCYGPPGFQMRPAADERVWRDLVGKLQLRRALADLAARCTVDRALDELDTELRNMLASAPAEWRDDSECAEAIGTVYANMGRYDDAVERYTHAVSHPHATATVRAIEQLANLESRMDAFDHARVDGRLERLMAELGTTPERCAMRGAAAKRRAAAIKDPDERRAVLASALAHYEKALEVGQDDEYVLPNVLQLRAILGHDVEPEHRRRLEELGTDGGRGRTFWQSAGAGDRLLVAYLEGKMPLDKLEDHYRQALETHPTYREWGSVTAQCTTLGRIAGDGDLVALSDRLQRAPAELRGRAG